MKGAIAGGVAAALLLLAAARVAPGLAWVACAPLFAAARALPEGGRRWRGAALLGATFGVAFAIAGHAPWLAQTSRMYFGLSATTAVASALVLCAACGAFAGLLLGLALGCIARLPGAARVLGSAAAWAAWENLILIGVPSYPWVSLAATQSEVPAVLQLASVAGQSGLSFVLAATGGCLAASFARRPGAPRPASAMLPGLAGAGALIAGTVLLGALRLHAAPQGAAGACSIAAVDANLRQPARTTEDLVEHFGAATGRALALRPNAIIWPESSLPRDPRLDASLLRALRARAAVPGVVLVAGGPRTDWDAAWSELAFNSVYGIAASGPVAAYDKRALVPFAEFWPIPFLPRPTWLAAAEVTAGSRPGLIDAAGCRIGVLVCFEAERPALARELVDLGANAIAVLSNDAQLPAGAVASEVAQARLRAVETGLPVLRAANAGASLAIDRYGRTIARPVDGVLQLVAGDPEPAPAARWGGMVLAACWVVASAAALTSFRRRWTISPPDHTTRRPNL